jgi:glycosyltransferase involved in cell wall biosynthesis
MGDPGTPIPLLLSLCIATYKRGAYIGETLEALIRELPMGVEIVIVDGASPDNTREVIEPIAARCPAIRYIRETTNSGVDRDFDKAVGYARGTFCWLMSDDDLVVPGAVARVRDALEPTLDLLIVNSQLRTADLSALITERILPMRDDRTYGLETHQEFFADVGDYLSFIGAVVIRRDRWLAREREPYFGTLFIHVAVIFQAPLSRIKVLAEPLILIRYGNAMWTSRGFEIWMFKWPDLIWSFDTASDAAKLRVVPREPWRKWRRLIFYRAMGAYGYQDYVKFFGEPRRGGSAQRWISLMPEGLTNAITGIYWFLTKKDSRMGVFDLARSKNASRVTRMLARRLGILGT